jgi:hypothetical protein
MRLVAGVHDQALASSQADLLLEEVGALAGRESTAAAPVSDPTLPAP